MNEEYELPRGWVFAKLQDVTPPGGTRNPQANGEGEFLYVDIETVDNDAQKIVAPKRLPTTKAPSRARMAIQSGDIIFSLVRPYLKNIAIVPQELDGQVASTAYCVMRPATGIISSFIFYSLLRESFINSIKTYGNSPPSAHDDEFLAMSIPLAPTNEQQRIVAAIEQQSSRLDAGVAALRRAQAKLKRYRAAVLKAAVEGKLTESWRAEYPTTEPASQLLERILVERRAKWEADLRAKGKDPAKVRYVEPAKPDVESLPELPEGWCWATVDQIAAAEPNSITDGPFGSNLKTEHYRSEGGRVIRLQNIGDGEFKDEKAFITLEHLETLRKHRVFAGDLVIAALGENPPRSCIIPDFIGSAIVKADCIRFKVSANILNTFVNVALNAEPTRKRTASQLHGIGRPRLNLTEIRSIVIPLPPLTEQQQIVSEVERRLSVVSQLESAVEANLKRAERLRQSILKEAFAGRLVPQDPDDEPASVLLERIRGEREKRKHGALDKGREVIGAVGEPVKIDVKETRQVELWESGE